MKSEFIHLYVFIQRERYVYYSSSACIEAFNVMEKDMFPSLPESIPPRVSSKISSQIPTEVSSWILSNNLNEFVHVITWKFLELIVPQEIP